VRLAPFKLFGLLRFMQIEQNKAGQ
jgi:hypothetical protein